MHIGIIADTHGKLHPRVPEIFRGVDYILHGGDIGAEEVLYDLRQIAPVTAVAGNIDGFQCGEAGKEARITLGGLRFYITHILDRPNLLRPEVAQALTREPADVVIFGHSHLPHNERLHGVWYFNPASAGPRRFDYPVSVGMFSKDSDGAWGARHIGLDERSEAILKFGKHVNQLSKKR